MSTSKVREVLLDTHVWIWLNLGSKELSKSIVELIDKSAREGCVYISAISIWEVATLAAKGRVSLNMPLNSWVDKALSQPGVELLPLSPDISIESAMLPDNFHGDPADRLIVASARVEHLLLLTRDEKILKYSEAGHLSAISV